MQKRRYAKNKKQLAALIGIGRIALDNLFARNDHPPQVAGSGYDIAQWQRYADNNVAFWNKNNNGSKARGDMINAREHALIRKSELAADREQFNLDKARDRYWLKEDAKATINRYANAIWRELEKAFVHEVPVRDDGLAAGEIAKLHRERIKSIRSNVDKILLRA